MSRLSNAVPFARARTAVIPTLLLACTSVIAADMDPEARFRGTGKADPIRIANVRRSDGPVAGQSCVTLDLAWDHSWRAAWVVAPEQHGGTSTLHLESWDAAWVFVRFRKPGAEGYSHATLSTNARDSSVPAGATLDMGLTDDGKRGVGAFVYRAAAGSGANDWKGVTLRWLHTADGVDDPSTSLRAGPGAVDLKVFAIQMVYVPQCAFWVGDGSTSNVAGQFSAGDTTDPFRIESEDALTLGGTSKGNLGNRDGIGMMSVGEDFSSRVTRTLPAEFPKGYKAFYCTRYEVTQGEFVAFLNTLSFEQQARLTAERVGGSGKPDAAAGSQYFPKEISLDRNVIRIAVPGVPGAGGKTATPAVYKAGAPHIACPCLLWTDCLAYAAWAGLRPMTELEYEKACRGPLKPVPDEFAWGTNRVVGTIRPGGCHDAWRIVEGTGLDDAADGYAIQNPGQPDERVVYTGRNGPDATRGNAPWWGAVPLRIGKSGKPERAMGGAQAAVPVMGPLRAGIFATPDSGRVAAGASYWGIMELTGNLGERVVTVGEPDARRFAGTHGNGGAMTMWKSGAGGSKRETPCLNLSDQPEGWHFSHGHSFAVRGGANGTWYDHNGTLRTSDRWNTQTGGGAGPTLRFLQYLYGFRCVRTAPRP